MKLKIIAHPNSKNPHIKKDLQGILHVYVKESAQNGEANRALIKALAERLELPKTSVIIKHGHTSKVKLIQID